MLQSFAAFFAYYWAFAGNGFTFHSLLGAGLYYRSSWYSLSNERKTFFENMCVNNHKYYKPGMSIDECHEPFVKYRVEALGDAQTAFLMTVVWSQIANVLIRKTQVASIFNKQRMLHNKPMMYSIAFEICLIIFITYTPGFNAVFYLKTPNSVYCSCALWIIPLLLIWDETRKYYCRTYPDGWIHYLTSF